MSMFKVSVVARNTKDESLVSPPVEAPVDTGSGLTRLPKDLLAEIKVTSVRKRSFSTATKQLITRETRYAILKAEGFEAGASVRTDKHQGRKLVRQGGYELGILMGLEGGGVAKP